MADTETLPSTLVPFVDLIPQHDACLAAFKMAFRQLSLPIFYHSLRLFLYAQWLSDQGSLNDMPGHNYSWGLSFPRIDLLFLACVFHDVGTAEENNGELRFEVEGGDAAVRFMRKHEYPDEDIREVWIAIACHTSPQIAERIGPLSRLIKLALQAEFSYANNKVHHAMAIQFEEKLPRLNIEEVLSREVVGQALNCRSKAPHVSWPHALLRAHDENPDYEGLNAEF